MHFTSEDLLRTRFAPAPAPLLELTLALIMLQRGHDGALFGAWRRAARRRLPRSALPLFTLVNRTGQGPMFLDPVCESVAEGLDRVLAAPDDFVACELQRVLAPGVGMTPWHRDLIARDRKAWQTLVAALTAAHDALIATEWPSVIASHHADAALRGHVMTEAGLRAALTGLYPGTRWQGMTLAIPSIHDRDEYLTGTGLTAIPSAYWTGGPLLSDHLDGSRLLVYPALTPLPLINHEDCGDPLAKLLGRTRAAALRALVDQRTTGELAAVIGVSASAASEHATTLRTNGLVSTRREGKAVRHSCTPLGLRLLNGI